MSDAQSKRKMAENEVIFRAHNEKVVKGIDKTNKELEEQHEESMQLSDDMVLHFYCECSDENCQERIPITAKKYKKLHRKRDSFIILKDHQVAEIEDVIKKNKDYWVVSKHKVPSEEDVPALLNLTPADNTH